MAELSKEKSETVRSLLAQAPDATLRSLGAALAAEAGGDEAAELVREMVETEARDRRLRDAVVAPLAPLFTPSLDVTRLSFPASTPAMLWRALKAEAVGPMHEVVAAGEEGPASSKDALCLAGAEGLAAREGAFRPLVARLEAQYEGVTRFTLLLRIAPILRDSLRKLDHWLLNLASEHDAAIRVAFRDAANYGGEAGFLFMEALFAHLDHPSQILRLISVVMDHPNERYLASSELASFGERLLDCIDRRIDVLRRFDPRRGQEGGAAAAAAATTATSEINEFEQQVVLSKEGDWGSRIAGQRRALALAMEVRLREAESAVAVALPTAARHGLKRQRGAPIVMGEPDANAVERALGLLTLLDGSRVTASHAGYGRLRAQVAEALDGWLDGYVQDLLELLHGGRVDGRLARLHLDVAADFVGLVRDPAAASLVRRRAAAA